MNKEYSNVVKTARTYYNSSDADQFYFNVWGGEDIHIGIYSKESGESIFEASRKTVSLMAEKLPEISKGSKVIDIGAGYGGSARYLAKTKGCNVSALNISEEQNNRNRIFNKEQKLDSLIEVIDGSFEDLPFDENSFDAAWSQDAILHSGNKEKVFFETSRVLKSGSKFIFTDPMQSPNASKENLKPVLERIHLDSMGSFEIYKELASKTGFELLEINDLTKNLVFHYSHVLSEIENRFDEIKKYCSIEYLEKMKTGLNHWINAGKTGDLNWGILLFKKR